MSNAMLLSAYEDAYPERVNAPTHDIDKPGYCEGERLECAGRGVRFHRAITLSPSDCEWRKCPACDGTGAIDDIDSHAPGIPANWKISQTNGLGKVCVIEHISGRYAIVRRRRRWAITDESEDFCRGPRGRVRSFPDPQAAIRIAEAMLQNERSA